MPTTFLSKKDNAKSTLASDITNSQSSFDVQAGHGTRFPVGNFVMTIWDGDTYPDPTDDSQMEKTLVITRSTDSMTSVTRGYDGTSQVAHAAGSHVRLLDIRLFYDEFETAIHSLEALTYPGGTFAVNDMLYATTATQLSRLAASSTTNQVIGHTAGVPTWVNPLAVAPPYVAGDIIYASTTSAFSKLGIGGTGAILKVTSALPAWLARGSANQVLKVNAGATDIAWADEYGAASIVIGETPTGAVNGSNTAYTLAATQATGSLEVFLNGQRMTSGGADYTEASGSFTMTIAPLTGDVLRVNYYKTVDFAVVGTNSLVEDETPTGTINGSNTAFTVLKGSFIANSLAVYLNGQKLTHTADFTETTPGSGTFAFVTAPATGAVVRVGYQFVSNTSGNADTVDGIHASATATASQLYPLNASGVFATLVPNITQRQGGSATDWTTTGTSTQTVTGPVKVQAGMGTTGGSATSGNFTYATLDITFPTAYTYPPLCFPTVAEGTGWCKVSTTTTQANIVVWGSTADTPDVASKKVQWIAIGI